MEEGLLSWTLLGTGVVNRALLGVGMASLTVILVLSAPAGRLLAKIMRAIYG